MTDRRFPAAGLAAALAAALLAGCSLVPEYLRPAPPVPAQFPDVEAKAAEAALPPWRDYFADPALQGLIAAALEHNRDLRIALARVAEARALAGVARADRLPTLEAQATGSRSRTPADLSSSGAKRTTSRYDAALGLTAFELDFWGRVAALSEAARAQYLASDEAARSFRIGLIGDVANTWYQRLELAERERLAAETLNSRRESLELTRKRRDAGLAGDLDVLAAESLAESVRAQWAELKRQRQQTENALRLLTGMAAELPPPARPAALAELAPGLPSAVLLRRPDVRAAEQRLIAANANIGAARAAFFPRISLTAAFGSASGALSGLFDSGSEAWSFQPALKLPLFDAGRNRANLDLAEARKVAAVADYEKTVQQAFREVADALAAQAGYREQLAAQAANLAAQQARLQRVQARAEAGLASYLEVLDAGREAFAAEQALAAAERQAQGARIALYKALGGGD
ncbi:multidrug efflux system outer membrane protein [Sulfuritortus calidifontis]|uniref:Multidrug efflux system outer membrane protein n=1 Tax=Sulfuritortus calidifontis TaxID=1914471 RepID=A0A4V2UQY2_9PROT|nr:efflux transporter outer membrane subunit [Sulfuritortus calidifontis]TCS73316.1 multidrug efflux system outer membrane protein [Sulfuritortus calidifontis]